jgi:hypothetical protein
MDSAGQLASTAGCSAWGKTTMIYYDQADSCTEHCHSPDAAMTGFSLAENDMVVV